MSNTPSTRPELFSPAWFDENFQNPQPIPAQLRKLSERMCRTYRIRGICDPMYIVNVAAFQLGIGNGRGAFTETSVCPSDSDLDTLTSRLGFAYSTCIGDKLDTLKPLLAQELGCSATI